MIWYEKRHALITLALLLVLNAVFFVTYRVRYEQRVRDLDRTYDQAQTELAEARSSRLLQERKLADYKKTLQDMETIYNDWWSTPEQRLTALLLEMRRLAETAQLVPQAISYNPESQKKEVGATALGIVFSVQGPYRNARQLINLIELSKQFVTIDAVTLSGVPGDTVTLNLALRTLFHEDPNAKAAAARQGGGGAL